LDSLGARIALGWGKPWGGDSLFRMWPRVWVRQPMLSLPNFYPLRKAIYPHPMLYCPMATSQLLLCDGLGDSIGVAMALLALGWG